VKTLTHISVLIQLKRKEEDFMVLRKAFVVLFAMFFLATAVSAADVEGVKMPDSMKAGGQDLVFNGGGKRVKFMMKVYVVGLYLKQKSSDAAKIVAADEPMSVKLQITSGLVTPDKMKAAIMEGFEKSTNGNITPIKAKIDAFMGIFKTQVKGDTYDFSYVPGKGTEIYKNGALSSVIEGLDFKKALYGIWLGDKPAQDDLKAKMLGK
jgi:hypothetical protein